MKIKILSKYTYDIYEELELVKAYLPFAEEIILYSPNLSIYEGIIESDLIEDIETKEWKFLLTEAIPFDLFIKPYELYKEDQMTMKYTSTSFIAIPESEIMFSNAKINCPKIKDLSLPSALELHGLFSDSIFIIHQEDPIERVVEKLINYEKILLEAKIEFNNEIKLHLNPSGEYNFSYRD